jgi:hypothetical protein
MKTKNIDQIKISGAKVGRQLAEDNITEWVNKFTE